jgi:hypothetical protein
MNTIPDVILENSVLDGVVSRFKVRSCQAERYEIRRLEKAA